MLSVLGRADAMMELCRALLCRYDEGVWSNEKEGQVQMPRGCVGYGRSWAQQMAGDDDESIRDCHRLTRNSNAASLGHS